MSGIFLGKHDINQPAYLPFAAGFVGLAVDFTVFSDFVPVAGAAVPLSAGAAVRSVGLDLPSDFAVESAADTGAAESFLAASLYLSER